MNKNKSGLNDSDNIFLTVALWISMATVFIIAITLPMLPDQVTIFYQPDDVKPEYYSKYNNLIITVFSVIPAAIIVIASALKSHGKAVRNFPSIMLFCIILSVTMAGVVLYGIANQFNSSIPIKSTNANQIIAVVIAAILSITSSAIPKLFDTPAHRARAGTYSAKTLYFYASLERYWMTGALSFLLFGIVASFITGPFAYIPLAVAVVFEVVFIIVMTKITMKRDAEHAAYDSVDNI